jgi:hypothetical protein
LKNSLVHFDRSLGEIPDPTRAKFGLAYAAPPYASISSAWRWNGFDVAEKRGAPRPRWKARLWAPWTAMAEVSARNRECVPSRTGAITS